MIAAELEAGAFASGWVDLEVRRSSPMYRRSPKIIWEDIKRAALCPLQKWQHRLTTQRRRRREQKRTARRTTTTIQDYYFSDSKWSETPAIALVSAYLDTLSTIVGAAEARWGGKPEGS